MAALVWVGTAVTMAGLAGLVACIVLVQRARREGLAEDALRARLRQTVALNLAAFLVAMIGLMMVVLGLILR